MFLYWDSVSKSHTSCLKQKQKTSTTNKKWEKKPNKQKRGKPTHWDLDLFLFSHYLPFFISHLNNYMSSFLSLRVLFPSSPQKAWFSWLGWVCSSLPVYLPSGSLCLSLPSRPDVAIILQLSSLSVTGSQAFICSKRVASFDFYFFYF